MKKSIILVAICFPQHLVAQVAGRYSTDEESWGSGADGIGSGLIALIIILFIWRYFSAQAEKEDEKDAHWRSIKEEEDRIFGRNTKSPDTNIPVKTEKKITHGNPTEKNKQSNNKFSERILLKRTYLKSKKGKNENLIIKCPECEKRNTLTPKKNNTTSITCAACGFIWLGTFE